MSKFLSVMGALALICAFAAPVSAQPGPVLCQLFPGLPGCPPPPPDLEDRVVALETAVAALQPLVDDATSTNSSQQSMIDALLTSTSDLDNRLTTAETSISTLQMCCDDLQMRVSRLEAVVDCQDTICNVGGVNFCIDTDTDDANCGMCGMACAANEECVGGTCQLIVCPPAPQCKMVTLMMDGSCVQTNLSNTTPCDDGLFCTAADICQSGTCVGFGTPCDTGTCNEDTNMCDLPPASTAKATGRSARRK